MEQDQCNEVAFNNIFVHDAEHAAKQCAAVDVANVYPSTSFLSQSMMGPQLEPAVDNFDDVQMNQVSIPTMAYVAALEKRISIIETQMRISNQNLQGRIKNLEHMMLD